MDPHSTWFDYLPGLRNLKLLMEGKFARRWTWQVFQTTHFEITHVVIATIVAALLILGAFAYRSSVRKLGPDAILPSRRLNVRGIFEGLADMVMGLLEGVMGEKNARRFLPFLGSFFIFILFSNLISIVPGF